jgi:hypothetical protein
MIWTSFRFTASVSGGEYRVAANVFNNQAVMDREGPVAGELLGGATAPCHEELACYEMFHVGYSSNAIRVIKSRTLR